MSLIRNSCCGLFVIAMLASTAMGQSRLVLVRAGEQAGTPGSGPSTIDAVPGETINVEAWIVDAAPSLLGSYQIVVPGVATPMAGAGGSIDYIDTSGAGGSVVIDTARPDWVFAGVGGVGVFYAEDDLPAGFGFTASPALGTGIAVTLGYCGSFQFEVSGNACGSFTVDFVPQSAFPYGGTLVVNQAGTGPLGVDLRQVVINVNAECSEACCQSGGSCVDRPPGLCSVFGGEPQGPGTTCADTPCTSPEACCFGDGGCDDMDSGDCIAQGGTPQGDSTTCAVDGCPEAPVIVHATGQPGETQPCTGFTDPKRESSNGVDVDLGLDEITLVFSMPVFSIGGGALGPADFEVSETGIAFGIDESQAVPPTGSAAHGQGNVSLNDAGTELTIHIEHNLAGVSAGHIHRAAAGTNGGISFPFASAASPIDAVWALNAGDVADLMAGNLYVNLHSAAFPGGEIRGQIVPNAVASVDASNNPTVHLTFERPISLQEWTTTRAIVQNAGGVHIVDMGDLGDADESDRHDVGFMPCDVDQSGDCGPFDLLAFRQFVNEIATPDCGVVVDFLDIDRNGNVGPFDLLAFRQLVNGISPSTQAWANTPMNSERP